MGIDLLGVLAGLGLCLAAFAGIVTLVRSMNGGPLAGDLGHASRPVPAEALSPGRKPAAAVGGLSEARH